MSLNRRLLWRFAICLAVLLVLSIPVFYLLTTNFYAEDMIDVVESARRGEEIPSIDLEEDVMEGVMLQFILIVVLVAIAMVLVLHFISRKLWRPFDKTLSAIESFSLEGGVVPKLVESSTDEFSRLNTAVSRMMENSLQSYQMQKEFTENASHELQTPLAVFQSKLDLLAQQPDITADEASIIQDLYQMSGRLSRLSRNLLLLGKMENRQFTTAESVDIIAVLNDLMPYLESIAEGLTIVKDYKVSSLIVKGNRSLMESMVNNLIVNAVRHNRKDGEILVSVADGRLTVANTSDEGPLDATHIFDRFYRASGRGNGYGLGLAIVKAVCDYHGWHVEYRYEYGLHEFIVTLG